MPDLKDFLVGDSKLPGQWYGIGNTDNVLRYSKWHRRSVVITFAMVGATIGIWFFTDPKAEQVWAYSSFTVALIITVLISIWTWGTAIAQKEAAEALRGLVPGHVFFSPKIHDQVRFVCEELEDFRGDDLVELGIYISSPAFGIYDGDDGPELAERFVKQLRDIVEALGGPEVFKIRGRPEVRLVMGSVEKHRALIGRNSELLKTQWDKPDWNRNACRLVADIITFSHQRRNAATCGRLRFWRASRRRSAGWPVISRSTS